MHLCSQYGSMHPGYVTNLGYWAKSMARTRLQSAFE